MDRIPPEIILALGAFLDRPSLFKALRICRRWSEILRSLAWRSISTKHPYLPYFPTTLDNSYLAPFLVCIRSLESTPMPWSIVEFRLRHISRLWTDEAAPAQVRTSASGLVSILAMIPNLTLSLSMVDCCVEVSLILKIGKLLHLKTLSINMPQQSHRMHVEYLFLPFARLEELRLEGTWHMSEMKRKNRVSRRDRWGIKKMAIDPINLSLVRYCPLLEDLRLGLSMFSMKGQKRL
ncbi:hypothetical protein BGX23_002877, partial [Mortierella sp. AD031]